MGTAYPARGSVIPRGLMRESEAQPLRAKHPQGLKKWTFTQPACAGLRVFRVERDLRPSMVWIRWFPPTSAASWTLGEPIGLRARNDLLELHPLTATRHRSKELGPQVDHRWRGSR